MERIYTNPSRISSAAAALTVLVVFFLASIAAAQPVPAGVVDRIQGQALAVQNANVRPLTPGSEVFVGEILSTGSDARLEIRLFDDSIFTLAEESSFVIVDFTFGGAANEPRILMRLMEGAFLAVSGAIAVAENGNMIVQTSVATIGIRGTTVWGGPLDGLFRVVLLDGNLATVSNADGTLALDQIDAGTIITGPGASPTIPSPWGRALLAAARATVAFDTP
jgi:hypothetical protein